MRSQAEEALTVGRGRRFDGLGLGPSAQGTQAFVPPSAKFWKLPWYEAPRCHSAGLGGPDVQSKSRNHANLQHRSTTLSRNAAGVPLQKLYKFSTSRCPAVLPAQQDPAQTGDLPPPPPPFRKTYSLDAEPFEVGWFWTTYASGAGIYSVTAWSCSLAVLVTFEAFVEGPCSVVT